MKESERFRLSFDPVMYRRLIANKEVVIHCHHYNARLQNIIEGTRQIDGKQIFLSSAEEMANGIIKEAVDERMSEEEQWQVAVALYRHLGFGLLDISQIERNIITAPMSHYVEGWRTGFQTNMESVCTFTEGYLQGAYYAITGEAVVVSEKKCMISGAERCEFLVEKKREKPFEEHKKTETIFKPQIEGDFLESETVDDIKIIQALVDMPIYGDDQGLIPAFYVYLANTPAEFYNLVCINYLEAMREKKLLSTAQKLLVYAGEVCALNTLRGIKNSLEWAELIAPMVKTEADNVHGLVAVTNALGWGNWHIVEHEPSETLKMASLNGYEALGYLNYKGFAEDSQCYMLTGVASGMMELLYRTGTVDERIGTFYASEEQCICSEHEHCSIHVEAL